MRQVKQEINKMEKCGKDFWIMDEDTSLLYIAETGGYYFLSSVTGKTTKVYKNMKEAINDYNNKKLVWLKLTDQYTQYDPDWEIEALLDKLAYETQGDNNG